MDVQSSVQAGIGLAAGVIGWEKVAGWRKAIGWYPLVAKTRTISGPKMAAAKCGLKR